MKKRSEPSNEAFLAAELSLVMPNPGRAAIIAAELCAIGRRYKRLSEKLCGGEEEWGRWSDGVEQAQLKAEATLTRLKTKATSLVAGLPVSIESQSLHLRCCTRIGRGKVAMSYQTALL